MYITAYCDWRVNVDDIGFFDEEFAGFVADLTDFAFWYNFACS